MPGSSAGPGRRLPALDWGAPALHPRGLGGEAACPRDHPRRGLSMAEGTKKAPKKTATAEAKSEAPGGQTATAGERCQVAKCKQPVRAKGYCRKHYIGWRRGKLGEKHRYNTCSKP